MLSTINRKLRQRHREVARGPLVTLIRWAAYHAMLPYSGADISFPLMTRLEHEVKGALGDLADAGALAYFGIRDAAELGRPPVRVLVYDDGQPPYGKTVIDVWPIVWWIMAGGAAVTGWRGPGSLTEADLA